MIQYKVIKNGIITNQWTSEFANETYYEPGFGKPERWVREWQEDVSQALDIREVNVLGQTITEYKLAAEYIIEQADITAQVTQETLNRQSLAYLESTDWMVVRFAETGVPIPEEVLAARAAARLAIVR